MHEFSAVVCVATEEPRSHVPSAALKWGLRLGTYPVVLGGAMLLVWALLCTGIPLSVAPYAALATAIPLVIAAERIIPYRTA